MSAPSRTSATVCNTDSIQYERACFRVGYCRMSGFSPASKAAIQADIKSGLVL